MRTDHSFIKVGFNVSIEQLIEIIGFVYLPNYDVLYIKRSSCSYENFKHISGLCMHIAHGRRCWNSFVFAEVMMMTWWHPLNVTFTRTVYDSDFSRILWYDFINKIWPNYSMDKWNESCLCILSTTYLNNNRHYLS